MALHAYKTTDKDIEALRALGYSEDQLFELTLSAALGAGMVRLECGLAALKGGQDASDVTIPSTEGFAQTAERLLEHGYL